MRTTMLLLLVACSSDEPDLHDVVDCETGAVLCEQACVGLADMFPDRDCTATEFDGAQRNCAGVRVVDGVEGCCYAEDDGVTRFAECE